MRINEIWIEEEKNRVKLCANIKLEPNTIEKWKRNTRSIDKKIFDRYRTDYLSEGKKFTLWYSCLLYTSIRERIWFEMWRRF